MKEKFLKMRAWLLTSTVEMIKPIYAILFQQDKTPWKHSVESLKAFPPESLGNALGNFLEKHNFDLVPLYENHDVYHVLLDYKASVADEAAMQFFLVGNGKWTISVWMTVLASPILLPEYLSHFIKAYKRGKNSTPIAKWDFQHLLNEPIETLKRQVANKPQPTDNLIF